MGIPLKDCLSVGKLLGIKVFINEYVAYYELGKVLDFRDEIGHGVNGSSGLRIPEGVAMIWEVKCRFNFRIFQLTKKLINSFF